MKHLLLLVFTFIIFSNPLLCQFNFEKESDNDTLYKEDPSIELYEKFNKIIGGDSVRYCEKRKCSGWIKDYYINGKLKHKGYYENGKLTTVYSNFYESGELERTFRVKDLKKSILKAFYKSGKKKSEVLYYNGEPLVWEDFYPNGKTELLEKYDKEFDHYICKKLYYENGNLQNILELTDKRNLIYASKEFYKDGKVQEQGNLIFNPNIKDYLKYDTWQVFDEKGNLKEEQYYIKGSIYNTKKFN